VDHRVSRHVRRCCFVNRRVGDRVGRMLVVVVMSVVVDDCQSSFSRLVGRMLVVIVMLVVVSIIVLVGCWSSLSCQSACR